MPSLTFEASAEPVKSVVERLSKETQTPLLCANDVGLRRVTAIVKDVDPTEFRARLAKAVGAEWVPTSKGLRLEIAPKTRGVEALRHRTVRTAWITKTLMEYQRVDANAWDATTARKLFAENASSQQRATEQGRLARQNVAVEPPIRAAYRILEGLGATALADIEWNEKRVWTTRTRGRFVLPLPEAMRQVVRTFNRESETLQGVFASNPDLAKNHRFSFVLGPRRGATDPLLAEAADVTIEVTRQAFSPDLYVSIFLSAANGTIVDSARLSLSEFWSVDPKFEGAVGDLANELVRIPVTLSPAAEEWFRGRDARLGIPASPLSEVRRHPERFEPLDMLYTDAFRAVAERKNLNIVAQVGDIDLNSYIGVKDARHLQGLFTDQADNVQLDSKWLVIGARDQTETDRSRLDRGVVGTYVRTILANGFDSVNASIPVVRATGGLVPHPVVERATDRFQLERLWAGGMPQIAILSLLDRFPASSLRGTLNSFNPTQRQAIEKYLYGPGNVFFQGLDPASVVQPPHIERLPHIAFPNGLPGEFVFDLKVEEEDVAFHAPPAGAPRGTNHAPQNVLLLAYAPPAKGQGAEPQYRLGKAIRYEFTIEQPGYRKTSQEMSDHWADLSRPAVAFSQLPDWFRQKVAAVRKGN